MKIERILITLLLVLALLLPVLRSNSARAQGLEEETGHRVALYLFWGEGCPSCASEKKLLESLALKYPHVFGESGEKIGDFGGIPTG